MNPLTQTTFFGYPSNTFWAASTAGNLFTSVKTDGYNEIYAIGRGYTGNINVQVFNYDYYGSVKWQRTVGSGVGDISGRLDIDTSNNLYVSARTVDNPSSTYLAVSLKYNSSGTLQWQRRLSGYSGGAAGVGVAADTSGNQYYSGYVDVAVPSNYQTIFYKRDSSGNLQWNRIFGPSGNNFGGRVVIDKNQTYLYTVYSSDVPTRTHVAKYNTSGTLQWQKYFDGDLPGLTIDKDDNLYFSGREAGGRPWIPVVIKVDTSGNIQWARKMNFDGSNYAVDVSDNGDVYCVSINLGTSPISTILLKYNSSGTLQWQRQIAYSGILFIPEDVRLDKKGNVFYCINAINNTGALIKYPNDGSITGTFGSYTISQVSNSDSASSISFITDSIGDSAASMTEAANSWTDSAGSFTSVLTNL